MSNLYLGFDLKENNATIKIANNETKEVVISTCKVEEEDKEKLVLLLMKKIEQKIRETL